MKVDTVKIVSALHSLHGSSTERLENAVGQSLIATALFTISFEATAVCFRKKIREYGSENDPSLLPMLSNACKTAASTINFCGRLLVSMKVIEDQDVKWLHTMRERRNLLAHEGLNYLLTLTVSEIMPEIERLHQIAGRVESWRVPKKHTSNVFTLKVSPAIFGWIAAVARQLCLDRLDIRDKTEIREKECDPMLRDQWIRESRVAAERERRAFRRRRSALDGVWKCFLSNPDAASSPEIIRELEDAESEWREAHTGMERYVEAVLAKS